MLDPLPLLKEPTVGTANLPPHIDPKDPHAISSLFFTYEILKNLTDNTNSNFRLTPTA